MIQSITKQSLFGVFASLAKTSPKKKSKEPQFPLWIDGYIKSKSLAWARTSQKNERSRLNKHGPHVFDDPMEYYTKIKTEMCAHSIKTTFTRLGKFHEYLQENGHTKQVTKAPWKKFLEVNAMTFKYAYQIEKVRATFPEAKIEIQKLEEPYRSASTLLLEGGLRYCELRTFDGEKVIGKGSKPRAVFVKDELKSFRWNGSYTALYVRLKAVGLKPHTLRKLWATELSRHPDIKDQDLCKLGGWSSIETSIKYRQAHQDEKMSKMIQDVVNKAKH